MKDFKLHMQVYNYRNEKCEIYDKFSTLERKQLCFLQHFSLFEDSDTNKIMFGWNYSDEPATEIDLENARAIDVEEVIKECFDYYNVKYDYVIVEPL